MYGAITLAMTLEKNQRICLATMSDLADLIGLEIRQARRLVAELERRGHVVRERVRTISGSPQGIRPTATLRGARTRSDPTDCNRSTLTVLPVNPDRAPGQDCPTDRSSPTEATIRRGAETEEQQQSAAGCAGVVAPFASQPDAEPAAPSRSNFLGRVAIDLADALALDYCPPGHQPARGARKSPGGSSAKIPPRGESRPSVRPDVNQSTTKPSKRSRGETPTEHKKCSQTDA